MFGRSMIRLRMSMLDEIEFEAITSRSIRLEDHYYHHKISLENKRRLNEESQEEPSELASSEEEHMGEW